ncbi:nucleotidyl transferase AbiEii/AbiGii toxin family protein [Patescibacteria group bacterium]|nr:nucleotidyl transferase AbiEii/AbiGii toxin family protein [Patescibacteria group bacterium]
MEEKDPRHLLVEVTKILQELKIPYIITGGMAVLIWGRPRFTADIDIVVELKIENVDSLTAALSVLGKASYIDKNMIKDALEHGGEFNFIHGDTGIKVDFWVLQKKPFELSRLKRRIAKDILGEKVYFISPEDLILSKLEWYEQTNSSRHLEDVESVLKISGKKLDMEYLKQWAKKLEVLNILKELINKGA